MKIKERLIQFLRWTEKYTETDMIYATKGSFWIIFSQIGISLIALLKMFIFGRWVDLDVFGLYSFIISMATIFAIFSLPGINTSIIKAIAQKKDGTLALAIKEKLKYSLLGSIASFAVSAWYFYNQNTVLGSAFLIVAIFLPYQSSFSIFSSFWIGRKDFKKQSKYSLATSALITSATIPIILTNNPVWIVLVFFISHSLFNGLFLLKTLKQKENNDISSEAINFGKNLTVMGAIGHFATYVDKIILWKFFGPVQLAIYSFAQLPIQQIQGVIPIAILALPKIGEKNTTEIKEGIIKKFKKLFFISIPLAVVVAVIAPYFYRIVLPQYIESVPYFQAFSFLILLSPFALFGVSLVAEIKKREIYIIQIAVPIIKMALFLILIPFFGIWGVVIAIIVSQLVSALLSLYFFLKIF